ncbi:hypothetical protein FA15DRAFT_662618 [Coprinopsis marcescibilis]|uniref:ER membrane protein complex subunit 7 beta-sandwich domain-containing protein n=1 Tax=Coprinopsis marcescibilis TaxID=230819 RepID=A0A5C3LEQ1_COPMA|nr:hypothetical protein FA15DRAFT_662618 [Coprinopsis marcescibilis]
MVHIWFLCYSLVLLVTTASALDIQGRIKWNGVVGNATALGRAKAVLDDGKYSGSVTRSGQFTIYGVPEGTYILHISSHDYAFDQLRIDVLSDSPTPEVRPYLPATPLNPPVKALLAYPITLSAKDRFAYFNPPQSFNIVSMLSNPMMLMMVFGGVMMLAMPYLMKNLDPEALASLEPRSDQSHPTAEAQSAFASGDFKGGFAALMKAAEDTTNQDTSVSASVSQKSSRASKKGRR